MWRLIMESGVVFWPILLVLLVILVLFVVNVVRLASGQASRKARASINAILFWGGFATVLGVLGQCMGLWKGFRVLAIEGPKVGVSPAAVAMGISESLHTIIFGLLVLVFASLVWLTLKAWWRRLAESTAP